MSGKRLNTTSLRQRHIIKFLCNNYSKYCSKLSRPLHNISLGPNRSCTHATNCKITNSLTALQTKTKFRRARLWRHTYAGGAVPTHAYTSTWAKLSLAFAPPEDKQRDGYLRLRSRGSFHAIRNTWGRGARGIVGHPYCLSPGMPPLPLAPPPIDFRLSGPEAAAMEAGPAL